jgi:hypothetical protein
MAAKREAGNTPVHARDHRRRLAGTPQFRQLYEGLARAIREGQFAPGSRLPSTRRIGGDWLNADWAIKETPAASSNDVGDLALAFMTRLLFLASR